jgi:uncharacterized repeat protein (TIGR02059 family)
MSTGSTVSKAIDDISNFASTVDKSSVSIEATSTITNAALTNSPEEFVNHLPTGSVKITGKAVVGSRLNVTASIGDEDGLGDMFYQWLHNDKEISGANGTSYIVTTDDVNKKISVKAGYIDGEGTVEIISSATTRAIEPIEPIKPVVSKTPTPGDDFLIETDGKDTIDGLAGNDTIIGGLSADNLTGGKGADVFKYNSLNDSGIVSRTRDTITDFNASEGDQIDLSNIDANPLVAGIQPFKFIGNARFDKTDATGFLRFDSVSHILHASTDADDTPEFSIALPNVKGLPIANFTNVELDSDVTDYFDTVITPVEPSAQPVPPELKSAVVNGNTLVLTYSEDLSANVAANEAFSVKNGSVTNPVKTVSVNGSTVTLELTNPVKNAQLVTVAYTDPTTADDLNAVQDLDGNDAASFAPRIAVNNTPDTKAPVFASAMVNGGDKLVMIFIEANSLDANAPPPLSAFSVKTGSVENPVKSLTVNADNTVTLTLTNPVTEGQAVQFSYTDPTTDNDSNAIQDVSGNDAVSIPMQSFVYSASDTMSPVLTKLVLPQSIDVSKVAQKATFTASFVDDKSGVHSVFVDLDKPLGDRPYLPHYDENTHLPLGSSGSLNKSVPVDNTSSGIINIADVRVKDFAGNEKMYSAADLAALELPTAFEVVKDNTAPYLTSLTLPSKIDVTAGKQDVTFSAKATDDGTGVSAVYVYWDKNLSVSGGTSTYANLYGNTGSSTKTVQTYTQTGTFNISSVSVYDNAGNVKFYAPADLKKLGFATSFDVAGAGADTTAPVLKGLSFPAIDVSTGNKSVTFTANVTDDKSGVMRVDVYFDKLLKYVGDSRDFNYVSFNSTGKTTQNIDMTSKNGTFNISSVDVYDLAGNSKSYTPAELKTLGIATSFEVVKDTTAPVLTGLDFPSVIDVSAGNKAVSFAAKVTDDKSGVSEVTVNLSDSLSVAGGAVTSLKLGNAGTTTQTVQTYSHAGTFKISSVDVKDVAGNSHSYTPAELTTLKIPTSFEVANVADRTAPVFVSASVKGDLLVMNYKDDTSLNLVTAKTDAFSVLLDEKAVDVVKLVSVDAVKNTITLTLTNPATNGQNVTISYTDTTSTNDTNAIQDVAGNDAISLVGQVVENLTMVGI